MWLLTNFGFFSIVQKPDDELAGTLTVRSRATSDLEAMRQKYLPSMGSVVADAGSDYKYRTKVPREALAAAMLQIVMDLNYDNFKDSVAKTQGHERAHLYHQVWDVLYHLQEQPAATARQQSALQRPADLRPPTAECSLTSGAECCYVSPRRHSAATSGAFQRAGRKDPAPLSRPL
jgi:hypothetical protein